MAGDGWPTAEGLTVVVAEPLADGWGLRGPLEALGYRVLGQAADGETAVALTQRLNPSLVILDLHLPGLNGLRAAERLQSERRSTLVFVASQWDPACLEAAVGLGAVACLARPLGVEQLGLSLRVALAVGAEVEALRRAQAELAAKLAGGKLVERAKGILMRRLGLGEAQAHLLLHHRARETRRPVAAVSEEVMVADGFFADLERSPHQEACSGLRVPGSALVQGGRTAHGKNRGTAPGGAEPQHPERELATPNPKPGTR